MIIEEVVVDEVDDIGYLEDSLKSSGWKRVKDNLELNGIVYRPWYRGLFKNRLLLVRTKEGKAP